jgi:nucleoside-diphosphate-sugar epimerase
VGRYLLPRLGEAGLVVHALARRVPAADARTVRWHTVDLSGEFALPAGEHSRLVHVAPLWLAPALVRRMSGQGLRRAIAFGSTSRFIKERSADAGEREIARRLAVAEDDFMRACESGGVAWTLFRPTLIYGDGLDRNVAVLARFIGRFGFFPLPGRGEGRRQPVHAEDLAAACAAALERPATFGKAYDLPGGTTLRYRALLEEIFRGLGRRPRIVEIPLPLMRAAIAFARILPGYSHLTRQMADRIGEDLCFEHAEATKDFGYSPRPFTYR